MASATLAQHTEDLGVQNLNISSHSDEEEDDSLERKRPAVSKLVLPQSINKVAENNFLFWNLSDLIDETPEGEQPSVELPAQHDLALEVAGVGLKVVKDKTDPENEDYVPADRATKVETLVCLRKILVLHEGEYQATATALLHP